MPGEGVVDGDQREQPERDRPEVVLGGEAGEQADGDVRGEEERPRGAVEREVLAEAPGADEREDPDTETRFTASKTTSPSTTATIAWASPEVPPPNPSTTSMPTAAASVSELTLKNAFTGSRRTTKLPIVNPSATASTADGVGSSSASATM